MTLKVFYGSLRLVVGVLIGTISTLARSQELALPKDVGPLPEYVKDAKAGAIVTAQHSNLYRSLLPPEIVETLELGEFSFEAFRAPREPNNFRVLRASGGELTSTGELKAMPSLPLSSTLFSPATVISGDAKQLAFQVLWNTAASLWRYRSVAVGISVYLFSKVSSAPHKLEFVVERIHPLSLGAPSSKLLPVFREKISAIKPSVISGLSWLTLRYLGAAEDFVWIASPVVRSIRQVTGTNRADPIFSGAFSPDDLFVWTGKVELAEPVSVSYLPLLVPVIESKAPAFTKSDGCSSMKLAADAALALQCQSPRYKNVGPWTPTNTIMVLRGVYRMELSTRDPFSTDSRQVLYVDAESGLPVYRVVLDQSGRRQKVSMGILRSLEFEAGGTGPALAGQILFYNQDGRRVVLSYDSWTVCDQYVAGRSLENFDPSSFVRFGKDPELPTIPVDRANEG